jgi:hypothetical protein
MKLTPQELGRVTALAELHERSSFRFAPGKPGSREQPLSFAQLLELRRRRITGEDG